MSDKVRAIVNPYMPPVDSAEQAPSNEPIESELIISGAATETEMIHTLSKPFHAVATFLFGSLVIIGILVHTFHASRLTLAEACAALLFVLVTAGILFAVLRVNSGRYRAQRILRRSPWLADPVRGTYNGSVMNLKYPTIQFWTALVSGRSEVWASGYCDQLWGYPLIVTASQFADSHWWRRLSIQRNFKLNIHQPTASDSEFVFQACRVGTWTQSLLAANSNRFWTAVRIVVGSIALTLAGWLLLAAWNLYQTTIWTPYWTEHYNRTAPPLWAGGGLALVVGLILVLPAGIGMLLNWPGRKYCGQAGEVTAMLMSDKFIFLQHDSAAIQSDWSHVRRVRCNRYGLNFVFHNRHQFFVPRIAFANHNDFLRACSKVKEVVLPKT